VALRLAALGLAHGAFAQNTTLVGVLHSLSGTVAISDWVLKDTILMEIEAINKKGGLADQYIVIGRLSIQDPRKNGIGEKKGTHQGALFTFSG